MVKPVQSYYAGGVLHEVSQRYINTLEKADNNDEADATKYVIQQLKVVENRLYRVTALLCLLYFVFAIAVVYYLRG
jgi:preprotein translocase subunit SecG